jgi:azurin
MQRHGIAITAWWFPTTLDGDARAILEVIRRHHLRPQLWVMGSEGGGGAQAVRVAAEVARLRPIAEAAAPLGCMVGLYNHGGWFGQPENQLEIIGQLAAAGVTNVGIVYNFHHGHEHLARFGELVVRMKPHLLAVNLNGMVRDGSKTGRQILHLGEGDQELEMLRCLDASGWRGPIGIIDHRAETDSEETLGNNLRGLAWLRAELAQPGSGRVRPFPVAVPTNAPPQLAPFFFANAPLAPADHPLCTAFVNRDRVYDFYAKQAERFLDAAPAPTLLPSFPGLDGGRFGHWGNQNEDVWSSSRWNEMDHGSMLGCIFRTAGKVVPRAVLVRLGEGGVNACFDPETLSWPAAWRGNFVRHSSVRAGFMEGAAAAGDAIEVPGSEAAAPGSFRYQGLYRSGTRVVFAFERGGTNWLEGAWAESGKVVRTRCRADEEPLASFIKGGPAQWPQWFETAGTVGSGQPYAVDTLPFPTNTPWHSLMHFGGHDFLPDGTAALCTFEGEVWLVRGIGGDLGHLRWKRYATGLSQALGLIVVEGRICVLGRDRITRLHDLNGDDEADFYENYCDAYATPVGGHDYVTGIERDAEGRFYLASGQQGILRTTPDRRGVEILATGFRNPNGLALGPRGEVVAAAQEGEWTPTSWLAEIQAGGHYTYGGPRPGPQGNLPPTLYIPRGEDNSCGGQCFVVGDRWGVPAGTLVHLSFGYGRAFLVLREVLEGQVQGCAIPLPGEFRSGSHRGRFSARDGQLYVTGTAGWGTYTPDDGCFQRLRYTGGPRQAPLAVHAHANGIRLAFGRPLEDPWADHAAHWFAQQWNYRTSAAYGSDEYSVRSPNVPGHDVLAIASAHLLDGGRTLFLELPDLMPSQQLHLHGAVDGLLSRDFYLTLHNLAAPFEQFPGYRAKDPHAGHVMPAVVAVAEERLMPVPWEQGTPGRAITLHSAPGLQFAEKELRARAGERISLTFENPDVMAHNWVLVKIGAVDRVGDLANRLVTSPDALAHHYVPESPDILCHTRLVNPSTRATVHFTAPAERGAYPYLCTFPGHWQVMRGVLIVE